MNYEPTTSSPLRLVPALPAPELAAYLSRVWGKPLSHSLKPIGVIQSPFSQSVERWEFVFEGVIAPDVTFYYRLDLCSLSRCEEGGGGQGAFIANMGSVELGHICLLPKPKENLPSSPPCSSPPSGAVAG